MVGMQEALKKRLLIVARAGHFCSADLIAERQAAVIAAIPEFSAHVITAGIAGKMFFSKVQAQGRDLTGRSIGSQDRL